jgi:hypothetical protein
MMRCVVLRRGLHQQSGHLAADLEQAIAESLQRRIDNGRNGVGPLVVGTGALVAPSAQTGIKLKPRLPHEAAHRP